MSHLDFSIKKHMSFAKAHVLFEDDFYGVGVPILLILTDFIRREFKEIPSSEHLLDPVLLAMVGKRELVDRERSHTLDPESDAPHALAPDEHETQQATVPVSCRTRQHNRLAAVPYPRGRAAGAEAVYQCRVRSRNAVIR
jgi:hypothetical protein